MSKSQCLLFQVTEFASLARPLGGHRMASWLRQSGWDAEVIDWANHWTLAELIELFQSRYSIDLLFVGFGHLFSMWSDTLEQFCSWIKRRYPAIVIISGSSTLPSFHSQCIDYYIQGFGEHATAVLLKWLFNNGPRPRFDLVKINGGQVIKSNENYPAFPMSSLLVTYETRDFIQSTEWLATETARGCKFKCKFCNFPVLGVKGDYSRDADDFDLQLRDTFDRFGVTNYAIVDETFNDRTEKISKFADVVEQLPFQPWFASYIRADLMVSRPRDREELLRMRVLGHYYGVESFNTQSARAVGKGMDGERLQQGLIECKNYFQKFSDNRYRGSLGLIIGLPHETVASLESTRRWLLNHWQGHSYTVYPLSIPLGELDTKSTLSVDFNKYGYQHLSDSTAQPSTTLSKDVAISSSFMLWKNEHMDIFEAQDIAEQWVKQKYQFDFRPSNFSLAQRLKNNPGLEQKLSMTSKDFRCDQDYDISRYVRSKLDWKQA